MSKLRLVLPCLLLLAVAACGEEAVPAAADDAAAEALPAPGQPSGSITGMPDGPGPGDVPLGGTPPPPPPGFEDLVPAPGEGLEPLQDNPEAGFGVDPLAGGEAGATAADTAQEAVAAVQAYYDAVIAGDYGRAYAAWSDGGRGSGRTPEQFAAGFQGVEILTVSMGEPGRVEGAAGSRYVEIPVTLTSRGADGREVRQVGAFTMRSSQVEGAAPGWHIASAEMHELRP